MVRDCQASLAQENMNLAEVGHKSERSHVVAHCHWRQLGTVAPINPLDPGGAAPLVFKCVDFRQKAWKQWGQSVSGIKRSGYPPCGLGRSPPHSEPVWWVVGDTYQKVSVG